MEVVISEFTNLDHLRVNFHSILSKNFITLPVKLSNIGFDGLRANIGPLLKIQRY